MMLIRRVDTKEIVCRVSHHIRPHCFDTLRGTEFEAVYQTPEQESLKWERAQEYPWWMSTLNPAPNVDTVERIRGLFEYPEYYIEWKGKVVATGVHDHGMYHRFECVKPGVRELDSEEKLVLVDNYDRELVNDTLIAEKSAIPEDCLMHLENVYLPNYCLRQMPLDYDLYKFEI